MSTRPRLALAAAATVGALVMTACAGGGASDTVGAAAADGAAGHEHHQPLRLRRAQGRLRQGDPRLHRHRGGQGRPVPAVVRRVRATSRARSPPAPAPTSSTSRWSPTSPGSSTPAWSTKDWNASEHKGIPFGSVVTIVVRKGNPKAIKDWDDLLQPGARGRDPQPVQLGLCQVEPPRPVRRQERRRQGRGRGPRLHREARHRPRQGAAEVRPRGDRDLPPGHRRRAAQLRERGALRRAQRRPGRARHAAARRSRSRTPPPCSPAARTSRRPRRSTTSSSRRRPRSSGREAGFRPVDEAVAEEFAADFPEPQKLWTIDDLGGWKTVDGTLFTKETGSIAVIYDKATK